MCLDTNKLKIHPVEMATFKQKKGLGPYILPFNSFMFTWIIFNDVTI